MNLKFFILTIFCLSISYGQKISGEIIYAYSKHIDEDNLFNDKDPNQKAAIIESLKKAFNKNYVLKFNQIESFFEIEKTISININDKSRVPVRLEGFPSSYYFNLKDSIHLQEMEYYGKEFLIKEKIQKDEWKITDESKVIGNFYCVKAIKTKAVTEQDLKYYEEALETYEKNPKSQLFVPQPPKPQTTTAWFSPEIPLPFGPEEQGGLPGMILELHFLDRVYLASKIILNPKKEIEIIQPNKGQVVSLKEFIVFEEEMIKRNRE